MLLRSWFWIDTIQFKNCENFRNSKTAKSQSLNRSSFSPFFLQTFNFDLLQFYSLLSHMDAQYLIWNCLQFLRGIVSSEKRSSAFKVWCIHSKCSYFMEHLFSNQIFIDVCSKMIIFKLIYCKTADKKFQMRFNMILWEIYGEQDICTILCFAFQSQFVTKKAYSHGIKV